MCFRMTPEADLLQEPRTEPTVLWVAALGHSPNGPSLSRRVCAAFILILDVVSGLVEVS